MVERVTRRDWRRQAFTAAEVERWAVEPTRTDWSIDPAVWTDGVHLMCRSLERLHAFAAAIGLKPRAFADHERHPHYDLVTLELRQRAVAAGAVPVTTRELVRRFRATS